LKKIFFQLAAWLISVTMSVYLFATAMHCVLPRNEAHGFSK